MSDVEDDKIYAYDLTWHQSPVDSTKEYPKGTRITSTDDDGNMIYSKEFTLHSQNIKPHGIWGNDEIM